MRQAHRMRKSVCPCGAGRIGRYKRFPHDAADPHHDEIVFPTILRTYNSNPYVSEYLRPFLFLEYDSSVADILSGRPERVSAKKGPPPSHSTLRFDGPPLTE